MMRIVFAWVLFNFFYFSVPGALAAGPLGDNPNFSRVQINPDDSVGEIQWITQDHNGFLWFAGRSGLARFDGYRFHVYRSDPQNPPVLELNSLASVFEDSFGELWVGAYGGGVARLNRLDDSFHIYKYEINSKGKTGAQVFKDFVEDDQHNLWAVGPDGIALYDRAKNVFKRYFEDSPQIKDPLYGLVQLQGDDYFLVGSNEVYLWNKAVNTLETIKPVTSNGQPLILASPRASLKDSKGTIWIGHEKGLYKFHVQSKTFELVPLKNSISPGHNAAIWRIFEDEKGILWLSTDGNGLMYFDPNTLDSGSYTRTVAPSSLGAATIRSTFKDKAGDLWISTFPVGLYHYDKTNNYFSYFANFIKAKTDLFANNTWAFLEDAKHNIWLGIDSLGLVYFDRKQNTFSRSFEGFNFAEHDFPNTVLTLKGDSHGNLWMGTWAQGVSRFNPTTKAFKHFNPAQSSEHGFVGRSIWSILEASNGDIYFGTMDNGIIQYSYETETFTTYSNNHDGNKSPNDNVSWSIIEMDDGRIWFGTNNGINIFDPKTKLFSGLKNGHDKAGSLSSNSIVWLYKDSKARLWACTNGGGLNLYHPESDSFTHISSEEGLKNKDVQAIIEDNNGLLWFTNANNISSLNAETLERHVYTDKSWIQTGDFNHGAIYKLSSGELLFGGAGGFNILNPDNVTGNLEKPKTFFTELELLNRKIYTSKRHGVINSDILNTPKITLSHEEPMFSLRFTLTNYRNYEDNLYTYKLDGFDAEWHKQSNNNKATYTHLDAGVYHFLVRAANNNGIWSDETKSIEIEVLPAPWKTWWAYCIYIAIGLGLFGFYVAAQQNKLAREKRLNTKLMELDLLKNEFMANMSHELRTPVNGIIGIAQAIQDGVAGEQNKLMQSYIDMVLNSGRRLERLINDVLDFSSSKGRGIILVNSCFDIVGVIADVVAECMQSIPTNRLVLLNKATGDYPILFGDPERTRRALYNLVANAIKYTEEGKITVDVQVLEQSLCISVQDTGIGIAPDNLTKIYDSFSQVAQSGAYVKNGIGLGLAVAKYFVDAQGGELLVDSTPGEGTTFKIILKCASSEQLVDPIPSRAHTNFSEQAVGQQSHTQLSKHAKEDADLKADADDGEFIPLVNLLPAYYPQDFDASINCKRILVVDDEAINRIILRSLGLRNGFVIYEAANGQEALDALERGLHCDLILLDIMMPKLSGIDTCRLIRKYYTKDQLPIIFISAVGQSNNISECFNAQGNDFLEKPINRAELLERIHKYCGSPLAGKLQP